MSYHPKMKRRRPGTRLTPRARGMGLGDISSVITTAGDIASDPYLPEVVCRIQQLKAVEDGQPVAICQETPDGIPGGIGLHNAMMPLRAYSYAQQNKWVYPVAILAILGIPLWLGYELGKG